jgi:hypothetical protein
LFIRSPDGGANNSRTPRDNHTDERSTTHGHSVDGTTCDDSTPNDTSNRASEWRLLHRSRRKLLSSRRVLSDQALRPDRARSKRPDYL